MYFSLFSSHGERKGERENTQLGMSTNPVLGCSCGGDTDSGVGDSWGTPGWGLSCAEPGRGSLLANKTTVGSGAASCGCHGQWWPSSDAVKSCCIPGEGKAHVPKDSSQRSLTQKTHSCSLCSDFWPEIFARSFPF